MIRRGRAQGWLKLPIESLEPWARFNGVHSNGISTGVIAGHEERGSAIRATTTLTQEHNPIMTVPSDLIVSKENVYLHAKSDRHLREVLEALGESGQTARGAILIFMLVQATHNCPDVSETIGVSCPMSQYIKWLPHVDLPTFWSDEDLSLLHGTSLGPATSNKIKSLYREFDHLRESTKNIGWCQKYWWDEIDGMLEFDDWKQVDAMYRSRALEFPGIGDCMVPCIDMANHASGDLTGALYESSEDGNGLLLLREGQNLKEGDEVTITYGDEKGACEMIFSYGFIEETMENARDILLGLDIPDDDPLKRAKQTVAASAPGVRLIHSAAKGLTWESDFIWLVVVNEEDGLQFQIAQTVDGGQELEVAFCDKPLQDITKLHDLLKNSPMWQVYQLRAVSVIQNRVEDQLRALMSAEAEAENDKPIAYSLKGLALKLRILETEMLERFYEFLEDEKNRIFQTQVVQDYLSKVNEEVDDFS